MPAFGELLFSKFNACQKIYLLVLVCITFVSFSLFTFVLNFLSLRSISFSTEDIDIAITAIDPSDIELPAFLSEYPCAQFLLQHHK